MTITRKNAQLYFTAILSLFWIILGLILGMVSVYLQAQGYSNSRIGITLAIVYTLSTFLQPALAAVYSRTGKPLRRCLAVTYAVLGALTASVLFLPLKGLALSINLIALFALQSSLQSSVNALVQTFEMAGCSVNFGAARGVGSLAYGLAIAIAGTAVEKVSPLRLPYIYLLFTVIMVLLLALPRMNDQTPLIRKKAVSGDAKHSAFSHPSFIFLLLASGCLSLNAVVNGSFMLQIMQNMGGNSAEYGIATAIPAIVEFPAMLLFSRFSKRFGSNRLLALSGWAWFAKNGLILLARSPEAIYAAQILQFFSYAFFIPGVVQFIGQILPQEAFLKGQSLQGSAYTAGSVIATLFGGSLLDLAGVRGTLSIAQLFSLMGAIFLTLAVHKASKMNP